MTLVDSNILIYAAQPEHNRLRQFIAEYGPAVSAVSYVEVVGYHQLAEEERKYLEEFFRLARILPLSQAVLDQAVALRQQRKMSPLAIHSLRHGAGVQVDASDAQCRGFSMD